MNTATPWGTKLIFEVSSAGPDEEPVWVDLSGRMLAVGVPFDTNEGRQTELSDVDPGRFSIQLRNRDDALTPGNSGSPYFPWWKQRRRCRFREIVGYLGFDLADGFLEIPENVANTQPVDSSDNDVVLTVSGIDITGWFQQGRKFTSTLGEYILWQGRQTGTLRAYFVLNQSAAPMRSEVDRQYLTENLHMPIVGTVPNLSGDGLLGYGAAAIAPGDDATSIDFRPDWTEPLDPTYAFVKTASGTYPVADTDMLTVCFWVIVDSYPGSIGEIVGIQGNGSSMFFGWTTDTMHLNLALDGKTASTTPVPAFPVGQPVFVAMRMRKSLQESQLIVRNKVHGLALSGSFLGNPMTTGILTLGFGGFDGRLGHIQVHIGPEADFGLEHLEAQRLAGLYGLESQLTGDRVNTVLDYAGFSEHRRDIDPGVSMMSQANLSGQSVQQALDAARDTEQGRVFAHGGRVVFHDRRRIYDV